MKKNAQVWQVVALALLAVGALVFSLSGLQQSSEVREVLDIIAELTGVRICPEEQCPDVPGAQAVRERIGIDSRVDSYMYWAADLIFYSDDHDTQKLAIDGATGNIDTEGTLDAAGAFTATTTVAVGTFLNLSAQTAISLSADGTITPTGTYQPLTSGAAVTTSTSTAIADGVTSGDLLILKNANASDVITIDGTGANVECKADFALGAGDTAGLLWNGSDWECLWVRDNS